MACISYCALALSAQQPRLEIERRSGESWVRLSSGGGVEPGVHLLESSTNSRDWSPIAQTHDGFTGYPDLASEGRESRFFRVRERPQTDADDWRHQAWYLDDPFRSPDPGWWRMESRWLKFLILLDEPHRVVFQDSRRYPFHYDFAHARVPRFEGATREDFDRWTLCNEGQRAVLGALIFAPTPALQELGIQFAGHDAFPRESVAAWFNTVRAVIDVPPEVEVFYLPSYEQKPVAQAHREWFAARGITVRSGDHWVLGDECYAAGWAIGRLAFVPAAEIEAATTDGRLGPTDILLTDAVPIQVPPVAGIITQAPATPNSHVAILAASYGIPFAHFADPGQRALLEQWGGQEVMLRVTLGWDACRSAVAPLLGELDRALQVEILDLNRPPELALTPKELLGATHVNAETLFPEDIRHVGGKAANFGLLRRSIPDHAPSPALAFSFDLWEAFMDQEWLGGGTLRQEIAARLAGFAWPPDMPTLKGALADIRQIIRRDAEFSPALQSVILGALQEAGFAADRKIRFRSSTNVEDSEHFTGAGLYDSYSGCLGDDLDGDTSGPSGCDPEEPEERGVLRALRRVYASFYNDHAFLERLRHGVDETLVAMGVLVHYSYPDEIEWANGVATFTIDLRSERPWVEGRLVTQKGAVSVANPDTAARPEQVSFSRYGSGSPFLDVVSRSSLVPLGGTVLDWPEDYEQLLRLLDAAAAVFLKVFPAKQRVSLDFEYKQVAPGRLEIKQIREIPQIDADAKVPVYLLGTPNRLTVFQGERGDVVANHRLKSVWGLACRHTRLQADHLERSLFDWIQAELRVDGLPVEWEGPPADLPGYNYARIDGATEDRWALDQGAVRRQFRLRVSTPFERFASEGPLVRIDDLELELWVRYSVDQPTLGWQPRFDVTREEFAVLTPAPTPGRRSLPQRREISSGSIRVVTEFYWPPEPTGVVAGYTAPLDGWSGTSITGLTGQPIVLRDDFAQTYRPGHHNFTEDFVFEPRLDPGVPPENLAELEALNIRALVVTAGEWVDTPIILWGLDERFREP